MRRCNSQKICRLTEKPYIVACFAALAFISGCVSYSESQRDVELYVSAPAASVIKDNRLILQRYPSGNIEGITLRGIGSGQEARLQWAINWFNHERRKAEGISDRWRSFDTSPGLPFSVDAMAPNKETRTAIVKIRLRK